MMTRTKAVISLYADRSTNQWVVRDPEGQFWIVPPQDNDAWEQRQPFELTEHANLEPIPGHYKSLLKLPF